jgi:hypothetical protein
MVLRCKESRGSVLKERKEARGDWPASDTAYLFKTALLVDMSLWNLPLHPFPSTSKRYLCERERVNTHMLYVSVC